MSYLKIISISYLVLINIISSIESKKQLKLVFVVHRHGDRTPVYGWPTNPYNDEKKYWPDGFGMLTNKGKQRMHSIGKYIRKRYKHFLTDNPREVYVRSSAKERCLESVSLLLAGLYPPVNRWKWDSNLGEVWQPFPINTMNMSHDGLLCPESICPLGEKETERVMRSQIVKEFFKKHQDIIDLIEEKSGLTFENYRVGRDMWSTLEIQKLNGLKLPVWVNNTVYKNIRFLSEMAFYFDSSTQLQHRLRAGLLLKEIVQNIDQSIRNSKFGYKIFLYSTHDTYLSIFLGALKAFNRMNPPFGATIFMELYQLSDNRHEIELHYLNETISERPYRLSFSCGRSDESLCDNCSRDQICPLDQFLEAIKNLIPDDLEKECKRDKSPKFRFTTKLEL